MHDFPIPELGKAIPYGVYDIGANSGWVSLGIDHDTAAFAVNAIRSWWQEMGQPRYPQATRLVITADSGGSNSTRNRLWKTELQHFADETGLTLMLRHLPPGTSKWNRIEHRLLATKSSSNLITCTRTQTGLVVRCRLDEADYPKGIVVSDDELAAVNISRDEFHGEWNYTIAPRSLKSP